MDIPERERSMGKKRSWPRVLEELLDPLFGSSVHATTAAPHLRRRTSVGRVLFYFVLASTPVLLVGLWNFGAQTLQAMPLNKLSNLPGWQWHLFTALGFDATAEGVIGPFLLGLAYFAPLLIMVLAAGVFWEVLFATMRRRHIDPGWLMACWLYALLLPPMLPLGLVVLGVSFGLVFGKHIFGGTGRYIVSPALLGVLFLQFSYPDYFTAAANFIPESALAASTTWHTVITEGLTGATVTGLSWGQVFLGVEIGAVGTDSSLLCLAGAAALIYKGAASARTVLGAFIGLTVAAILVNTLSAEQAFWQLPWYWHMALGNFAFGVAFIATDPTPAPMTAEGRYLHGILIGVLTVLIRTYNPMHPEGTLYAILLAALATPVIDHFVIRIRVARGQRRWRSG